MKAKILVLMMAMVLVAGISAAQAASALNIPVVLTGTTPAGSNTVSQFFQISPDGVLATIPFVPSPANMDLVITEFTVVNGGEDCNVELRLNGNLTVSVQRREGGEGCQNFRMTTGFAVSPTGMPLLTAVISGEECQGPATIILRGYLIDPPAGSKSHK
jgi:hypothetical protein